MEEDEAVAPFRGKKLACGSSQDKASEYACEMVLITGRAATTLRTAVVVIAGVYSVGTSEGFV